jgi:hypothetical protein
MNHTTSEMSFMIHTNPPGMNREWKISLNKGTDSFLYTNSSHRIQNPKHPQEPDNNNDHHHYVEDVFDLAIHRDIVVYQPENNTGDNQYN